MNQFVTRHAFASAVVASRPTDGGRLTEIEPDAFLADVLAGLRPVATEVLGLSAAGGRIVAADIRSPASLPPFDQSAMDGFGIAAADLEARGAALAIDACGEPGRAGRAVRLYTGSPVPDGVAAILRREDARRAGDTLIAARSIAVGADIRRRGEDVRPGDRLASAGAALDPRLIALLAATGVAAVGVRRKVRVAVLSTGDELIGGSAGPVVHDANGPMLRALLAGPYAEIVDGGVHPDDPARLAVALQIAAATADLVITSGGSAGSEVDVLVEAAGRAGGAAVSQRLALKPGKPIVTGAIGGATFLGLPGNPFAAFVSATLFALPAIAALAGRRFAPRRGSAALLAGPARPPEKRREFLPATIVGHSADGRPLVEPGRVGAARLAPLAAADGLVELAPHGMPLETGQPVAFHPAGNVSR